MPRFPALLALTFIATVQPLCAAELFPTKGVFTEPDSESELNFGKRYLGFPDEECSFSAPKRLGPGKWRIKLKCDQADGPKGQIETATLQRRGKGWRLTRGTFKVDFKP
jgi:hypothetical protein